MCVKFPLSDVFKTVFFLHSGSIISLRKKISFVLTQVVEPVEPQVYKVGPVHLPGDLPPPGDDERLLREHPGRLDQADAADQREGVARDVPEAVQVLQAKDLETHLAFN